MPALFLHFNQYNNINEEIISIQSKIVDTQKKITSINEDGVEYCSYCGTQLNFNIGDWVLKQEIILEEK